MLPRFHFLLALIVSFLLLKITSLSLIEIGLFFLASFLIDADHYLWHVIKKRNLSLRKAYRFFRKREFLREGVKIPVIFVFVFHTVEAMILLVLLSLVFKFFIFIFLGSMFHIFLDALYGLYMESTNKKVYSKHEISLIVHFLNKKIR